LKIDSPVKIGPLRRDDDELLLARIRHLNQRNGKTMISHRSPPTKEHDSGEAAPSLRRVVSPHKSIFDVLKNKLIVSALCGGNPEYARKLKDMRGD